MKEQFDKELRDHIKDTFDVFDDQMADDGWKKYQWKLRKRKILGYVKYSLPPLAAALALLWVFNLSEPAREQIKAPTQAEIAKTENITPETSSETTREASSPAVDDEEVQTAFVKTEETGVAELTLARRPIINTISSLPQSKESKMLVLETAVNEPEDFLLAGGLIQSLSPKNNLPAFADEKTTPVSDFRLPPLITSAPAYAGQQAYTAGSTNELDPALPTINKFNVSLDASTFMNFSEVGVNDNLNVAVGVTSEYRISKNLSINAGLNINKQSTAFLANVETVESNAKNTMSFLNLAAPVVSNTSSTAQLVGIDLPIALKYSATSGKNFSWFVSTGLGSSTLLNESYFNNISIVNYSLSGTQMTTETVEEENYEAPFSNMQLARTLNFSVGVQFPIKNVTSISVEPFIKYPLRGFGKENLEIGSSGVSLKLNLTRRMFQ